MLTGMRGLQCHSMVWVWRGCPCWGEGLFVGGSCESIVTDGPSSLDARLMASYCAESPEATPRTRSACCSSPYYAPHRSNLAFLPTLGPPLHPLNTLECPLQAVDSFLAAADVAVLAYVDAASQEHIKTFSAVAEQLRNGEPDATNISGAYYFVLALSQQLSFMFN